MTTRPSLLHSAGQPDALLVAPEDHEQVRRFLEQKGIAFSLKAHPSGLGQFELPLLDPAAINRLISALMALPR
jgi:hypothetical protein